MMARLLNKWIVFCSNISRKNIANSWVKCCDALPKDGDAVVIFTTDKTKIIVRFSNSQRWFTTGFNNFPLNSATHWATLPEDPTNF